MVLTHEDMLSALREVRPSAMKEVTLEVPKVNYPTPYNDWYYFDVPGVLRCCGRTLVVRKKSSRV